jgi:hypothetical protein
MPWFSGKNSELKCVGCGGKSNPGVTPTRLLRRVFSVTISFGWCDNRNQQIKVLIYK